MLYSVTRIVLCGVLLASCAAPFGSRVPSSAPHRAPSTHYLFDDEFDGHGLDLTKWQPNWLGPNNTAITPSGNAENCYDPALVTVPGDGYLHLRAVSRRCTDNHGHTSAYASGLVNSYAHFRFTYGHVEARIFLPGHGAADNWPAFWADGTGQWPATGENDIVEGLGGHDCWHFHSPSGGPGGCAGLASASGWHTFAADWRQGAVTYFYDGTQVGRVTSGVTSAPMYLIVNLAISRASGGPLQVPSEMLVDYVRVWA